MSEQTCSGVRDRFSRWFDGQLAGEDVALATRHLEGCAACRAEWESFQDAVRALRSIEVAKASRREVDLILAAVDVEARKVAGDGDDAGRREDAFERAMTGTPPTIPRRRRAVVTHAAALVVGMAAAVVVLPWIGGAPGDEGTPRSDGQDPGPTLERTAAAPAATVSDGLRLVLDPGSRGAQVLRDGHPVDPDWTGGLHRLVPRPGDVVLVEPGEALSLALGDGGSLRIEARAAEPPPPRVVEREVPVERIRYVARGPLVEIDGEALARAVDGVQGLFRAAGVRGRREDVLDESPVLPPSGGRAREDLAVAAPPSVEPSVEPSRDVVEVVPEAAPAAPRPTSIDGPHGARVDRSIAGDVPPSAPRPVLVQRIGRRVRVETFGMPYEVIPELIAHLDSGDEDVSLAARLRLEEIRDALASDPRLSTRLASPPEGEETESTGTLGFVKGLFADEPAPPRTETESWQAWWERNAIHILEAGTWGTF